MRKKDLIELGITGILVTVLLFLVVRPGSSRRRVRRRSGRRATEHLQTRLPENDRLLQKPVSKVKAAAEAERGLFVRLQERGRSLRLERDPFAPSAAGRSLAPLGLHLSGIAWDKQNPQAIINDMIVGIGDEIGASTVVDIKEDEVILRQGGRYFHLRPGQ